MTHHLETLERLVAEEHVHAVQSRLDSVKRSFGEFEENAQYVYDTLENEDEIEASDGVVDMQTAYTWVIPCQINQWFASHPSDFDESWHTCR